MALAPLQPGQAVEHQLGDPHHDPAPAVEHAIDGARVHLAFSLVQGNEFAAGGGGVLGWFCHGVGKKKIEAKKLDSKIQMVLGDGEKIPYTDNYFDVITVAYGVRNFENLETGLSEILRVLKPNGLFIILETSVPTQFPFKQGYYVYTNFIMPTIGKLFSKDKKAYAYLSNSAQNFPFGEALNNILRKIGFIDVVHTPQTMGVATIYKASKL